METNPNIYNRLEWLTANAAIKLCKACVSEYASDDVPAATFAALWQALETHAAQENIKFRLVFGNDS